MKYELGTFDACAKAHGDTVIEEMKKLFPPQDLECTAFHSVVVCVYADGYLQFAGGNGGLTTCGIELTRAAVKAQAKSIVSRMGNLGFIDKDKMEVK